MNTRPLDEHIKSLKIHEQFLQKKLKEKEEAKSHYLRKELIALQWMISYTEDTKAQAAEHHNNFFQKTEG